MDIPVTFHDLNGFCQTHRNCELIDDGLKFLGAQADALNIKFFIRSYPYYDSYKENY